MHALAKPNDQDLTPFPPIAYDGRASTSELPSSGDSKGLTSPSGAAPPVPQHKLVLAAPAPPSLDTPNRSTTDVSTRPTLADPVGQIARDPTVLELAHANVQSGLTVEGVMQHVRSADDTTADDDPRTGRTRVDQLPEYVHP
jgi:hypothetical protein